MPVGNLGTTNRPFLTEQEFRAQFDAEHANGTEQLSAVRDGVMMQYDDIARGLADNVNRVQDSVAQKMQQLTDGVVGGVAKAFDAVEQETYNQWSAATEYGSQAGASIPSYEEVLPYVPTSQSFSFNLPSATSPAIPPQTASTPAEPPYPKQDMGYGRTRYDAGRGCCCVDSSRINALAESTNDAERTFWRQFREQALARFGPGNYGACKKPGSDTWEIIQGTSLYNVTFQCDGEVAYADPYMGKDVLLANCTMVQMPDSGEFQFQCRAPTADDPDRFIGYESPSDGQCASVQTEQPTCKVACDEISKRNIETCTDRLGMQLSEVDRGPCGAEASKDCCPPPIINVSCGDKDDDKEDEPVDECGPFEHKENGTCVASKPAEKVQGGPVAFLIDWSDPGACAQLAANLSVESESFKSWLGSLATSSDETVDKQAEGIVKEWLSQGFPSAFRAPAKGILGLFIGLLDFAKTAEQRAEPCSKPSAWPLYLAKATMGVIQRWTGIDMSGRIRQLNYALNAMCPRQLPQPDEVDTAYLMGEITPELWDCWTKANDQIPKSRESVLYSKSVKPGVAQLMQLYLRGEITEPELNVRLREAGVLRSKDVLDFKKLLPFMPGTQDVITMMVRDVADDQVAQLYGYDDELDDKYKGDLKRWARANGVTDDVMQKYWRAHWKLPSNTEAYTMLHRLRDGRVDDELVTDEEDVERLLGINDIPKYWRDRLMAISYANPRLVDIRNGYLRGVITHAQLVELLQDRGYDRPTAELVGELFRKNRKEWAQSQPIVKDYIVGGMTREETWNELLSMGFTDAETLEVMNEADRRRKVRERKTCLAAIRKRFLCGEMDVGFLRSLLVNRGYNAQEIEPFVQSAVCELSATCKRVTASMLCTWFQSGLITRMEIVRRLLLIGWSAADAERIALTCQARQQTQQRNQQKQKDREDAAKQRAAERAKKDQEAAKRRDEKTKQATQKAAQQSGKHSAQTVVHLLKTTGALADLLDSSDADARELVEGYLCILREQKGLSTEDGLDILDQLIKRAVNEEETGIEEAFRGVLELLADTHDGEYTCPVGEGEGVSP